MKKSQIEVAAHEIAEHLKKGRADYIEARLEESWGSTIGYRGRVLETIGKSSSVGGSIRALVRGGWGFTSFNNLEELDSRVKLAIAQARAVGKEKSQLADIAPAQAKLRLSPGHNPLTVPLTHKKELLDRYNEIIWATSKLQTSIIRYGDARKKTIFLNSEGAFIEQERADVTLNVSAIASNSHDVQQANLSTGSPGDYAAIAKLDDEIASVATRASNLLAAPHLPGGKYTVVLDPILAGVFVHEAFGHLSEADHVCENPELRSLMRLGKCFGPRTLNIVDGAKVKGLRGSYLYDDEGVPATKTYLIKDGILTGRLHSRETAAKMGEPASGNARALSYRHPPIVRMTNTYIESGQADFQDMIADIKEGVYAVNWYGGTTSMEMFTFSAGEAYMIRNGHLAEMIKPVVLSGNVFTTLANIDAIGCDLAFNQGGGCGKGGQSPLPVSNGSPHIRLQKCLVGGKA
ncbi:MAG: TldD/PmbA family protein [Dehalococcoidia bacterium]|nr:TldD/PmbA family protein [Dehalococcoidia bacterium]